MSYCRWSCDNFKCDLYCYESVDGYVIHVASMKYKNPIIPLDYTDGKTLSESYQKQMKEQLNGPIEDIGLPCDGQDFILGELEGFKEKLLELRKMGYHFPNYVLEQVEREIVMEELKDFNPTSGPEDSSARRGPDA